MTDQARANTPGRLSRSVAHTLSPGALRPSDMLAAFFGLGILFLLAGATVAVVGGVLDWRTGHWVSLHLIFVGGISQLVLGAGQFFAGAFLATDPPPKLLIRWQLIAWNAGTLLVLIGVPRGSDVITIAGAALLAGGLLAFVAGLRGLRLRSVQRRPWAIRWYQACATLLGVGVLAGVLMETRTRWPAGSLVGAHVTLNVVGWFGTAIVGTLHTLFPSLTQTHLRHPRLERPTFGSWIAGTVTLAAGYGFAVGGLVIFGWAMLMVAAGMLSVNLVASLRATPTTLPLAARLIASAQTCLVVAFAIALANAIVGEPVSPPVGEVRAAIATLLIPGWLGLTVAGALLHLLAVLARVRDLRRPLPRPRPARDNALSGIAVTAVLALAAARAGVLPMPDAPPLALVVAAYTVFALLSLGRAAKAIRLGPRRSPQR